MGLKICYYAENAQKKDVFFKMENLTKMGFDVDEFYGQCHTAFEHFSKCRFDILIVNGIDVDKERLSLAIDIIYDNYCKNILLLTNEDIPQKSGVYFLPPEDLLNLDLKIDTILLEMKRNEEGKSSKNVIFIKNKICGFLINLCFNSRLDGFRYYVDAVCKIFLRFPEKYSMMDIYGEIGEQYGKSAYAIEKSMRSALLSATKKINALPDVREFDEIRGALAYDMNNKLTTNMLVNKLMLDDDIKRTMNDENLAYALNVL